MIKYNNYIQLSPHYESVVDLDAEERNPNLWQEYIVHEDMRDAVDKICQSIKEETKDARRSFWIHGAYGTGKSYAAIVLKHLFEDSIPNIETFLSKQMLQKYRSQFIALREKGDYLVVWKSGCQNIRSGLHLMMEMEMAIRDRLLKKYRDKAYFGKNSLINSVHDCIQDPAINWQNIFNDHAYGLCDDFSSFAELYQTIMNNDLEATERIAKIMTNKGFALFKTVESFQDWLADIIKGNHLSETGIVFIWDEFTEFLRNCGDDNVLQPLSEYCKQQPFFMCLIVHRDPGWVDQLGKETYDRILHRYHELEFHISESAAYDLIGDSIIVRPGMKDQWDEIKGNLLKSLNKNIIDFDDLELGNTRERIKQLCPIHPMTLSLLARVAQNYGASQRTLFRFMKDPSEAEENVGFIYYINNNGPDDWRWLTPDYLWDYFFTRDSDVKEFNAEARQCYQLFEKHKDLLSRNDIALHVFKAAILLMSVMTTSKTALKSRANQGRVAATKKCLYLCFSGQLLPKEIDGYLEQFEDNEILRLDKQSNGDARLELPYTGKSDIVEVRLAEKRKNNTRKLLLKKDGLFSKALEDKLWDNNDPTEKRMNIAVCDPEKGQLGQRLAELKNDLEKKPYKIGLLMVVISEAKQFAALQADLKQQAMDDTTSRLIICMAKNPLEDKLLEDWYVAITHGELANEEGKKSTHDQYQNQAEEILQTWAETTAGDQMVAFYQDVEFNNIYGKNDLIRKIKKNIIFEIFTAAPELVVEVNTAYKTAQEKAITAAIKREMEKSAQINNILNAFKNAGVWEIDSIDKLVKCDDTAQAKVIATLATLIQGELAKGVKIRLDDLWLTLQKPPYGYYDNMVTGALLGFVFGYYVNGDFNWIDDSNNPFILTDQHLTSMITKLCKGKAINHTLCSGSEIWHKFRDYIKAIFKLSVDESANEDQARKYVREKIINAGTPFWVLKYLPLKEFGSYEDKEIGEKLIDSLSDFIANRNEQEEVMDKIINYFTGRGRLRKTITDAFANEIIRLKAFHDFLVEKLPELQTIIDELKLSDHDIYVDIKRSMQQAIYLWEEPQVVENLNRLYQEYKLIVILNNALGQNEKSISDLANTLKNCFSLMKIPGTVIEGFNLDWTEALKVLHQISLGQWNSYNDDQKRNYLSVLSEKAKEAWQYVNSSKLLLELFMKETNRNWSNEELNRIYGQLKAVPYASLEVNFSETVKKLEGQIEFERNKVLLSEYWVKKSGTSTIEDWCKTQTTPIQWVVKEEQLPYFSTVKAIQDGTGVDNLDLCNAIQFLENQELGFLKEHNNFETYFVQQIDEAYRDILIESKEDILKHIRVELGSNVYQWQYKVGYINKIVKRFAIEKMKREKLTQAKQQVVKMDESILKSLVETLLEEHPEFCELFIAGRP